MTMKSITTQHVTLILGSAVMLLIFACSIVPEPIGSSAVSSRRTDDFASSSGPTPRDIARDLSDGLPKPLPTTRASQAFWDHWADGKAEISGYRITTNRYGELRDGTVALIYVKEPMDRRTWIKDDTGRIPAEERVRVLKLNNLLKFQTGIYPYTVMTSVFAPVDGMGRERFAPAKISVSAQEWCGHLYHQLHPKGDHTWSAGHSYFSSAGDKGERIAVPPWTLYEDALLVQLRELDGPFADGGDWSGSLVHALWQYRKSHEPIAPLDATIKRDEIVMDGVPVTRFTLQSDLLTRTIYVEKAFPRKILGWDTSDGEKARLTGSERLTYWKLNNNMDEAILSRLGLKPITGS
jgi:hypothetical protein